MASLADTLDALAGVLQDALGNGFQVTGRMNFNPTPPSIDIYPGDPFQDPATAGFGDTFGAEVFTVRARVTTADHAAGQDVLLSLMDDQHANSVAAALMDDQTLDGLTSSVKVDGPSGFVQYVDAGAQGALLGTEWRVTVLRTDEDS